MQALALLATVLLGAAAPRPPASAAAPRPDDPLERRREALAKDMVRLGAELKEAVEAGDVAALVTRVPASGLRCGARLVPHAKVARDLRTRTSWLHRVFFGDAARPEAPRGRPASLRAFFREARDVAVLVAFRADDAAGPLGMPCIDYRAEGLTTPGAPLCFERKGGRWWFAHSLYPCG
jgi:hypothetical protein